MRPIQIPLAVLLSFLSATCEAALPAAVATALEAWADECAGVDGKPETANAVKRIDLNGDGREDFVLFTGWIHCVGAASIYGDREKSLTVFVEDDQGGVQPAFSDWVYDVTIEGTGTDRKLWLSTIAERCGKPPAKDFASENFCDRAIIWRAEKKAFEYAPVSTVRMSE